MTTYKNDCSSQLLNKRQKQNAYSVLILGATILAGATIFAFFHVGIIKHATNINYQFAYIALFSCPMITNGITSLLASFFTILLKKVCTPVYLAHTVNIVVSLSCLLYVGLFSIWLMTISSIWDLCESIIFNVIVPISYWKWEVKKLYFNKLTHARLCPNCEPLAVEDGLEAEVLKHIRLLTAVLCIMWVLHLGALLFSSFVSCCRPRPKYGQILAFKSDLQQVKLPCTDFQPDNQQPYNVQQPMQSSQFNNFQQSIQSGQVGSVTQAEESNFVSLTDEIEVPSKVAISSSWDVARRRSTSYVSGTSGEVPETSLERPSDVSGTSPDVAVRLKKKVSSYRAI